MLLLPAPKPKKALEVPVVFDAPAVTPANKLIVPGELKRRAPPSERMEPLKHADAGVLNIAYYEEGPANGPVVILLHGFPYDIHTYVDVSPQLAAQGCRVIVPCLRGFGATRFRDPATLRSGEQAAIGADVIALMDALGIPLAVLAGHN